VLQCEEVAGRARPGFRAGVENRDAKQAEKILDVAIRPLHGNTLHNKQVPLADIVSKNAHATTSVLCQKWIEGHCILKASEQVLQYIEENILSLVTSSPDRSQSLFLNKVRITGEVPRAKECLSCSIKAPASRKNAHRLTESLMTRAEPMGRKPA
jgi:hypothetical protein